MAIDTSSNTAFIEQQIYSQLILENLHTGLLPDMFFRNVTDFGAGDTLNIPTVGTVTIQDLTENEDPTYNPIDSGRVNLTITENVGDAWYITDEMREDGYNIDALISARAEEGARALKEYHQTSAFQALYDAQTLADPNNVNGFSHRFPATGTNETMTNADLADMSLSFDKGNAPQEGRILIVDPVVATTLERSYQGSYNVDSNPTLQAVLEQGMAQGMQFRMNLFGWNVFVSNLLPDVAAGTDVDGTGAITNAAKANIFMCIADDNCTPLMSAWRRQPSTEVERNSKKRRDEHTLSSRWGFGAQRVDTLGIITTSATHTA
jgi:hypothetical protein